VLASCPIHPREVFKPAILANAAGIILLHNHPSGDPSPSQDDLLLTSRLREAGEVLGIQVVDHVILGYATYASLKERGQI
jgi:DNA repair proteins